MASRSSRSRFERVALVFAATVGTLPLTLLASAALARFLPLSEQARFATGFALAIPLWVAAMCVALLSRSGTRALLLCTGLTVLLATLVFGIAH